MPTHLDPHLNPRVEMFREARVPKGRNRFSCPLPIWELLWEIGHAFGWQPAGTTYVRPANSGVQVAARRNYRPGGSQDHKLVDEQDAVAWARALEAAKASPHLAAIVAARSVELLAGTFDEFTEFCYGGAFSFSVWDDAES